ncbi:hypothetical protein EDB83DRAFT_2261525, partial [Lactarius deliciosus]
ALLPHDLLVDTHLLCVGCNEGSPRLLVQSWRARRVDTVSPSATRIARDTGALSGATKHLVSDLSSFSSSTSSTKIKRSPPPKLPVADYFPASRRPISGPLPIPPTDTYLDDINFRIILPFHRADWVSGRIPVDEAGYDVIFAFLVSKWTYLNGGNARLTRLLERVHATALGLCLVFK